MRSACPPAAEGRDRPVEPRRRRRRPPPPDTRRPARPPRNHPPTGAARCPSEPPTLLTNHRAARRRPAALPAPITLLSLTRSHILRRWLTRRARLSMESHPELLQNPRDFRAAEPCGPRTPSLHLQCLVLRNQTPLPRTSPWLAPPTWTPPPLPLSPQHPPLNPPAPPRSSLSM